MTRGNMLHIYYGSTDLPILPESYTELEARAKTGFYPTAERYYTSGMLRAEQSFRAIYGDTPHSVLYGMREADFGDFEMRNYAELKDDPAYIKWISGNNEDNICPNGESGAQVTARALEALKPVISEGVDAVVVAHGPETVIPLNFAAKSLLPFTSFRNGSHTHKSREYEAKSAKKPMRDPHSAPVRAAAIQ